MLNRCIWVERIRKNDNDGMEKMEKITDHLCITDNIGSNNAHLVGMDPVDEGMTVTVKHSASYN